MTDQLNSSSSGSATPSELPVTPKSVVGGSVSGEEGEITLRDVNEWANLAMMFIAHNHLFGGDAAEAIAAIHRLERLARLALEIPGFADLRWALQNDPYCHAAYAYGAREAQRRMESPDV
jgi:hypothetical protein